MDKKSGCLESEIIIMLWTITLFLMVWFQRQSWDKENLRFSVQPGGIFVRSKRYCFVLCGKMYRKTMQFIGKT